MKTWLLLLTLLSQSGPTLYPELTFLRLGGEATLVAVAPQGANFQALVGVSGTRPGFELPGGVNCPINLDWLTEQTCNYPEFFENFCPGFVYEPGYVQLVIHSPMIPGLTGTTLYVACAYNDGTWHATNSAIVCLIP